MRPSKRIPCRQWRAHRLPGQGYHVPQLPRHKQRDPICVRIQIDGLRHHSNSIADSSLSSTFFARGLRFAFLPAPARRFRFKKKLPVESSEVDGRSRCRWCIILRVDSPVLFSSRWSRLMFSAPAMFLAQALHHCRRLSSGIPNTGLLLLHPMHLLCTTSSAPAWLSRHSPQ